MSRTYIRIYRTEGSADVKVFVGENGIEYIPQDDPNRTYMCTACGNEVRSIDQPEHVDSDCTAGIFAMPPDSSNYWACHTVPELSLMLQSRETRNGEIREIAEELSTRVGHWFE